MLRTEPKAERKVNVDVDINYSNIYTDTGQVGD